MKMPGILACCLLAGCATVSSPENILLSTADAPRLKPLRIQAVVAEEQSTRAADTLDTSAAHASAGVTGNPLADVLGHVLGEMLIRGTHGAASTQRDPLLDFTRRFDFRTAYFTRLKRTAARSKWLAVREVALQDAQASSRPTSSESLLSLSASYGFSGDYRQLFVTTSVELWAEAQDSQPVYRAKYRFESAPAGTSEESLESILDLWSKDGAIRFRRVLGQGIAESMRMLRAGVLGDSPAALAPATDAFPLASGRRGAVLSRERFRLLAVTENGDLLSLPQPEAEREEYEAHIKRTYHADAIRVRSKQ